ncbi:MAG TPA: GNAT family N-acetyltransferase [Lacipirellula sp.]
MYVRCVENIEELDPVREAWNALAAGHPFRAPTWLTTWWQHYGDGQRGRELRVWLAFSSKLADPASLQGVLPCYLESTWTQGRVLRLLGDGEVCSDHLGLVAASESACAVAETFARRLAEVDEWDLLDFAAVDSDDAATHALGESLALDDCTVSRLQADRCWVIDLPSTWDDFLAMQSKSHRKQLRQMTARVLESDRARWQLAESPNEFATPWSTLVELHQRRRKSLGEPGCFASPRWAAFHWDVAQHLLDEDSLRLSTLELDGRAIAAEYHLAGARTTYAYQGGVDPDRLHDEPGQLSTICSIKRAIDEGHTRFDFLRGDEPYKAHWRATPRQAVRLVAVPPRMWPKLRRGAWTGLSDATRLARFLGGRGSGRAVHRVPASGSAGASPSHQNVGK